MPGLVDRIGKNYGNLRVIGRSHNDSFGNSRWQCICFACDKFCVVLGQQLTKGQKSCGCITSPLRPYESLYHRLQKSTKHKVELTYEEFEEFTRTVECHYCGEPLVWRVRYAGKGGWQLDRKDTTGAYSKNNVVVCCKRCNFGKGNRFTYDEWVKIGKLIRSWRN
jgi:hypothetical protein